MSGTEGRERHKASAQGSERERLIDEGTNPSARIPNASSDQSEQALETMYHEEIKQSGQ